MVLLELGFEQGTMKETGDGSRVREGMRRIGVEKIDDLAGNGRI